MREIHLRQPRLTYSACGTFTKNKERIQKFKEARDSWHVYQNKLDKACLTWYGNAYESFEDLPRRTASDKVLRDKAFHVAKNQKYDAYQSNHVFQQFINFLIKRRQVVVWKVKIC